MIEITEHVALDPSEIGETFIHASGPGRQNVNNVATAVQLRFDLARSPSLPEEVRDRARRLAGRRITKEGEIVIAARRFRTREQNREDALARLVALLRQAAKPVVRRRATRPGNAAKARRLDAKTRRGRVKQLRGRYRGDS